MRREIIYHIDVPPNEMTKQEAIEQDRQQPWREKISSWEMEDMCAMMAMALWAKNITDKEHMRGLMRRCKAYTLARSGAGMLKKAFELTAKNISAVQLRTITANLQHITLSDTRPVKGFVNLDVDALEVLIQETLAQCREKFCMQDEKQSRKCQVRQALDNTLNAGKIRANRDAFMGGLCPYCLKKPKED